MIGSILSLVVGGIGSIAGSQTASAASEEAAAIQAGLLDEATQLQMDFLGENRTDIRDAVDAGIIDLQEGYSKAMETMRPVSGAGNLNQALDLIQDPIGVYTQPQTQAMQGAGESAAASMYGDAVTPGTLAASSDLGKNMAATRLSDIIRRMTPSINREVSGSQTMANLASGQGSALANLRVGGVADVANVTGSSVPGIASSIEGVGSVGAANIINQANTRTNLTQNLASLGVQGAQLFSG